MPGVSQPTKLVSASCASHTDQKGGDSNRRDDLLFHLASHGSVKRVSARLVECADSRTNGCRTADACRLAGRTPPHTTHTRRRSRFDLVARSTTSARHDPRPPRPWPVGRFAAGLGWRRRGLGVRRRPPERAFRRDRWPGSSLECSRPLSLCCAAIRTARGMRRLSFHALGRRAVQGGHRSNRRKRRRAHRLSRPGRRSARIRHVRQPMAPQRSGTVDLRKKLQRLRRARSAISCRRVELTWLERLVGSSRRGPRLKTAGASPADTHAPNDGEVAGFASDS
jgi:hypothetical protein